MALKAKPRGRWWSRFHFLIRFAGLTGLLVAGVGLLLVLLQKLELSPDVVRAAVLNEAEPGIPRLTVQLLAGGAVVALLALLVEMIVVLRVVAGRRSAFGLNAAVQFGLAVALLAGMNVYSFRHYFRSDWTRDQIFTLPQDVRDQLKQLQGETTIVLYKQHKTFEFSDKPDAFDYAAEEKVTDKVQDLVDQFREFGPQFRVIVLDVKEEELGDGKAEAADKPEGGDEEGKEPRRKPQSYSDKLRALPKELREAIAAAPENSIFFHVDGKVQRLSFNDFYRLDKEESRQRENLVLRYQGVEPFARRVLNVDEKRPRIGILVVHEWLTTAGPEEFGLGGVKKALTARGFDVRDIILKKWSEVAPPEPAVYTYDESKYERVEEQLAELDADIKNLEAELKELTALQKLWQSSTLEELTKKYAKQLEGRQVNEALRRRQLAVFEQNLALREVVLKQYREERGEAVKEKSGLNVEGIAEQRRMTDLKAKMERSIADCDLLLIPRMTLRNVSLGDRIPNRLYRLDDAQVNAIKDFVKAGKPVFACFGPTNEPPDRADPLSAGSGPDDLEDLLSQLGIRFGKQTVLFNVESKSFAERRSGLLVSGAAVEVPPVDFDATAESAQRLVKADTTERKPNPLRESMQLVTHSLGKGLDLRLRHPRPIYYDPSKGKTMPFDPDFMMTSAASWNEDQPFPSRERTPRFEPPKPDDPTKGTPDEKRLGPFPIGVAVETDVPADWYANKDAKPATVRVAAIGHGGLFVGSELSPAKEQLLLNTCNWLLGRDDLLPHSEREWSYPRASLGQLEHDLWQWGAWLVLPGLFAYIGLVVVMMRRLR